ncbi:MAG: hypothetical protein P4M09_03045 [Devosia sp.]|nr:hypothetical protein [Devosia sp.]
MSTAQDDALLGRSLALSDGDFSLVDGDLAMVGGRQNLSQGLQVIIGTPFGSDPINVNYGLDIQAIYVTANSVRSVKDVIRLNIVKSLAIDDRVREISNILFDDEAGFAALAPEFGGVDPGATARRSRLWHAVVSLALATGVQQVVVSGAAP